MLPLKNILIPVNFFNQSSTALEKALELYEPSYTTIHLVHVLPNKVKQVFLRWLAPKAATNKKQALHKLAEMQQHVKKETSENAVITMMINKGHTITSFADYIRTHKIDLVIACSEADGGIISLLTRLNTAALTKESDCPVLVITPGCLNHPIKTILINVGSFIPEKKIEVALEFARRYRAHIYLVTILNNMDTNKKTYGDAFYKTYKILKDYGHEPDYKILTGNDSTEALLRHAQMVKADMILLNPLKQHSSSFFINKSFAGLVNPLSALHVLMVNPYQLKR